MQYRCPMISRRGFLAGCGACGLAGMLPGAAPGKPRIRLVFTHNVPDRPAWPWINFDYEARQKELVEKLAKACPGVEFVPATVLNKDDAAKLVKAPDPVDGYLVYMVGIWTEAALPVIVNSLKPILFVDDLYGGSGEFLIQYAQARRWKRNVAGVSSSRFEDVAAAAQCFELLKKPGAAEADFSDACMKKIRSAFKPAGDLSTPPDAMPVPEMGPLLDKLRASRILIVGENGLSGGGQWVEKNLGPRVVPLKIEELDETHQKADRDEASKLARKWIGGAEKRIEPSEAEIENSARLYLGMRELLRRHEAQAIAINCLGGFYGGRLKAYPCLGFCQLNDDGMVGACEADLMSATTMVMMTAMTGRPGYISDPAIDTSKNQIIYAHCVAPTKVFGPSGASNPYHLRSHAEAGRGPRCGRSSRWAA